MGDSYFNVSGSAEHVVQTRQVNGTINMSGDGIGITAAGVEFDVSAVVAELKQRAASAIGERASGLREAIEVIQAAQSR